MKEGEVRSLFAVCYVDERNSTSLKFTIKDAIAFCDKVAIVWTAKGTHKGEIKLLNLPATEKSVSWTAIIIYCIAEGKVVEERGEEDALGLLQQLGLIPTP